MTNETNTTFKRKLKKKNIVLLLLIPIILITGYLILNKGTDLVISKQHRYLAGSTSIITVYNEDGSELEAIPRGTKVVFHSNKTIDLENSEKQLYQIEYNGKFAYIEETSLEKDLKKVVKETDVYVRTPQNLYEDTENGHLLSLVNKGDLLEVIGYDKLLEDGTVLMYQVKKGEATGYIYSKYVTLDQTSALSHYEPEQYYAVHENRGNRYGGGSAANLDYFPVEKPKFSDNPMPENVYALYLNGSKAVINNVDEYISLAKSSKINAFVVDIKDNESAAYNAETMKKYSITNYEKAYNTKEEYKAAIQKLKDAGFYVIGRITVFKDKYYAIDHPEHALANAKTGGLFEHYNTYWPSPYHREVWEFNVELAKESVREMGFNEIQFDYVRFPDRTLALENSNTIDFRNLYQEEKAQAIQRFLQYATDELHKLGVYVAADVFGESAHTYVTAYGQYFPAISNVVDVICAMPYPDHFNKYEYGFDEPVWTIPYDILNYWGKNYVMKRQIEIPTPAIARTWIQTYDTIKEPYITYGAKQVEEQIQGLYDAGLKGGYMTWNSGSSLSKYKSQLSAYSKEYDT